MKQLFLYAVISTAWIGIPNNRIVEKHKNYSINYTLADSINKREYISLFDEGIKTACKFFNGKYSKEFEIVIHPNRNSLDSTWRNDWKIPDFKSECWMVASGVANKLDIISPKLWDKESCEHHYSEKSETQQLITHELVHVFHGQLNVSPDFSDVSGIDWFVEGLATYASGQCNSTRIAEIQTAITDKKIPDSLDNFWSGKLRYSLSGSVVMFIDKKYGRKKLTELLKFNRKSEILSSLHISEAELLSEWKNYMQKIQPV